MRTGAWRFGEPVGRRPLIIFGLVALATALRFAAATHGSPAIPLDSFDFAVQSRQPIFSVDFWSGGHSPLLGLVWRLDPHAITSAAPPEFGEVRPLVLLNAAIGAICWGYLALVVAAGCRRQAIGVVALVLVLLLSLSPQVAGWDAALLSDSLSTSLVALSVALAIAVRRNPTALRAVAFGVGLLLLCLAREWNLVLAVTLIVATLIVVSDQRRIVLAAAAVAVGFALWGHYASPARWQTPFRHSVAAALAEPGGRAWFTSRGLPLTSNTRALLLEPRFVFETDPRAANLRTWISRRGRTTWYRYLLDHPHFAAWPVRHPDQALDGSLGPTKQLLETSGLLTNVVYLRGIVFWIAAALILVASAVIRPRRAWLGLIVALVVFVLLVSLAAPAFDRVAAQENLASSQVALRIALALLAIAALDEYASRRQTARSDAAVSD